MHGQYYGHGGIAKRQGLVGGLTSHLLGGSNPTQPPSSSNTDPPGLGPIVGGVTSGLLPLQSSLQSSVSLTSTPSSSSVSSTSSLLSLPPSRTTHSSVSSTPSGSSIPTSSTAFVATSGSNGTPTTVPTTVSASSSINASIETGAPNSFFQNKPLETGVFVVVGIIGAVIIILLLTVWIRSSSRRRLDREVLDAASFSPSATHGFGDERGSVEKLTRWSSTSSAAHTQTTTGQGPKFVQEGYPVVPLMLRTQTHPADDYGQPSAYRGQQPQGLGDNREHQYAPHALPPSPNLVHDPARTLTLPDWNVIPATLNNGSYIDEVNPDPSSNTLTQRRGSLSDSPPVSLPASSENKRGFSNPLSSHSRALNPGMQDMPVAPPLPAKFGTDEDYSEMPYSGIESDFAHDIRRALKVANQ